MKKRQDRKADKESNIDMQKLRKKLRQSQVQARKTKELIEAGKPQAQDIMNRIETIYKETRESLEKQFETKGRVVQVDGKLTVEEYQVKKKNLKDIALLEQHHDFIKSPEKIREDRQRLIDEHNFRLEQALYKKKEIEEVRKQAIIKVFEEHSESFRKEQKEREMEVQKVRELNRKVVSYLNCEILVRFLRDVAVNHLKQKREDFLFNMKARFIQWTFRKHRVLSLYLSKNLGQETLRHVHYKKEAHDQENDYG
jgi:hypothetical protein